jgi:hypothetical protein
MQNMRLSQAFVEPNLPLLKAATNHRIFSIAFVVLCTLTARAQQITGVWKGKIKSASVELKLIKSGDSLVGTSYYYASATRYRRYSVKGYFDPETNNVIWWDDMLIEEKAGSGIFGVGGPDALLSVADFNCPGEDKMLLDGNSSLRDDKDNIKGPVHLQKIPAGLFNDEWNFVIDNYTVGTNDPYIIDSISRLAGVRPFPEEKTPVMAGTTITREQTALTPPAVTAPDITRDKTIPATASSNENKFTHRKKNLQSVIPITGRTIELKFYDNAAIDGDSIAIFLNGKLLREHILLGGEPQVIKLNVDDLQDDNELVMVAENLGTIPPNTSYLVAIVGNKRYEARLFADENSSALIRFIKNR